MFQNAKKKFYILLKLPAILDEQQNITHESQSFISTVSIIKARVAVGKTSCSLFSSRGRRRLSWCQVLDDKKNLVIEEVLSVCCSEHASAC